MNEHGLKELINTVESVPLHKFIGLKITDCDKGKAELQVTVTENILNPAGSVHGGIFYTICDVTAFIASNTIAPDDCLLVTSDINVSVLSTVNKGILKVKAEVLKAGKRLYFAESKVFDQNDRLLAVARMTKSVLVNPSL